MDSSIGLFEFYSISDGLKMTDIILKSSNVQIHKNEIICPGKYALLVKGEFKAVSNAVNRAKSENMVTMLKAELIADISNKVFEAINRNVVLEKVDSVGVLETKNYVMSLVLADLMIKSANITIQKIPDRLGVVGKGLVIYSGSTSEVSSAHNSAIASKFADNIISSNIIHKPSFNYFNV
ncbi:MAG: hypothetical protein CVU84_09430 [Firmicutes bacterium HGW-Firmicutes-1]|jgi:microcompartment protein CcmL/EutN|nr:MAG: hypothetical protein CVU84_09430 [Firmicutes bacterium HGW-Firmicutes-1]